MAQITASSRSVFVPKAHSRILDVLAFGILAVTVIMFVALSAGSTMEMESVEIVVGGQSSIDVALPYVAMTGDRQGHIHFSVDPIW